MGGRPVTTYAFVDTETTGLHPDLHEVWEFAAIKRDAEGIVSRLWFMLPLERFENADPFALNIGKFWERYKSRGTWEEFQIDNFGVATSEKAPLPTNGEYVDDPWVAARMIREFLHETVLVGNVISFDAERIGKFLRKWEQVPTWHYHILDIEPMIYGFAKAMGKTFSVPYKSSELTEWLEVPEPDGENRHTAMGDALWVMAQWDRLHL